MTESQDDCLSSNCFRIEIKAHATSRPKAGRRDPRSLIWIMEKQLDAEVDRRKLAHGPKKSRDEVGVGA